MNGIVEIKKKNNSVNKIRIIEKNTIDFFRSDKE